jgi:protein phosphatase
VNSTRHAGLTDRGQVRPANEDHWFGDDEQQLYMVADGMGGHPSGELAARIVVETLPAQWRVAMESDGQLSASETVDRAVQVVTQLSRQLRDASQNQIGLEGMGTTLVFAWIRGEELLVVHLGDSSAFLLRNGLLNRLTTSHTLLQLLVNEGAIAPNQDASHPAANRLTRYMGMDGEALPEAQLLSWRPNDRLLLCSDGLTGSLEELEIQQIVNSVPEPAVACQQLIDAANRAGGRDNITALIVCQASETCGPAAGHPARHPEND